MAKKLILTIDDAQLEVDASDLNAVEWQAARALVGAKSNKQVLEGIDQLDLENVCAVAAVLAKRAGLSNSAKEVYQELLNTISMKTLANSTVDVGGDEPEDDDSPLS